MTRQDQQNFPIELISWNRMYTTARELAHRIRRSGFAPEMIVAIARGGYVPARILCDFLGVRLLCDMRVVHYGAGGHRKTATLAEPLSTPVEGRQVLLVDDVTDTGDTLQIAMDHIKGKGPAAVRSAVLIHKTNSPVIPDFYGRRISRWRWTLFPWAVIEDLSEFIAGLEKPPQSPEEARELLLTSHQIKVPLAILRDIFPSRP